MPARGELHFTPDGVSIRAALVTINIDLLTEVHANKTPPSAPRVRAAPPGRITGSRTHPWLHAAIPPGFARE
jgi:hypothetical protein